MTPEQLLKQDQSYSVRRYYVDRFFLDYFSQEKVTGKILDIGGKKNKKRGLFNVDEFGEDVSYVNIDETTDPDILASSESIPLEDGSVDVIILSEVLEHLESPEKTLKEASRLLKPGGKLLIVTPFMIPVHGDPDDFGRYTPSWYKKQLENELGLALEKLEMQGHSFSVLAYTTKQIFNQWQAGKKYLGSRTINRWLGKAVGKIALGSIDWDKRSFVTDNKVLSGFSTGIAVVAKKL